MEGDPEELCCCARNAAEPQGKKVVEGRCGRTIEAKPLADQTCLIEPAKGVALDSDGRTGDADPCHRLASLKRYNG